MFLRGTKQLLLVFLFLDRNILGSFYKIIGFIDKILCHFLNLVLIVFFLVGFSNQKTQFFDILFFVSTLQLEGLFFPMCGIQFLSWRS